MKLLAVGVSHKTAPLEVREQLAVQATELVDVARTLKSHGELDETVLISTCNRVEIYATTRRAIGNIKSLFRLLCSETADLTSHIYLYEGVAAARHLFGVTAGLDSMVLGETEITGQIKNAYEIARAAGLTGRVLNCLFQKALQATKEIRTRTAIGRGAVSIKSAAVELIEKILGEDLGRRSIMVIGAGQMAECSLRLLVKKGARWILVANRSSDRAIDLAIQYGAQAICLGDCLFEMPDVDVVIAATSSAETLLYRDDVERLMEARRHRPLLLIDLAVPRNIDPAVRGLAHVALYNIDDLEAVARRGVQARERELAACHQIIEAHVAALIEKLNAEDERLSAEERNNRWVPNAFVTPSNRLPTAA